MPPHDLNEFETTVKEMVLRGYRKKDIASATNHAIRTIYNTIERLERWGHLVHIVGTRSPKCYSDGIATLSLSVCNTAGTPKNCTLNTPPIDNPIPPHPFVKLPNKTVRVHYAGAFSVPVTVEGLFGRIADDRGFTVGGWMDSYTLKGGTEVFRGYVRFDGGETKFTYFRSKKGARTFNIYPDERNVYYKHAVKDGEKAITEQVSKIMSILKKHGWGFDGNASPNGELHYGSINPDLLPFVDFNAPKDDDGIFCDRSGGNPEIETTARNPYAQNDIDQLTELPLRLRMMEHFCLTATDMLERLQENQDSTARILVRIQESQTTILELMTGVGSTFSKEGYA